MCARHDSHMKLMPNGETGHIDAECREREESKRQRGKRNDAFYVLQVATEIYGLSMHLTTNREIKTHIAFTVCKPINFWPLNATHIFYV